MSHHTLPNPHRRVQATIMRRPEHVNGNPHHHGVHLDSLIGLHAADAYHSSTRPDTVFIPVMTAIQALARIPGMGMIYWGWQDDMRRNQIGSPGFHQEMEHYDGCFALPLSCCSVTEPQ